MALCTFIKAGGDGCRTPALRGSKLCLFHDPRKEAERRAARSSGEKESPGRAGERYAATRVEHPGRIDHARRVNHQRRPLRAH